MADFTNLMIAGGISALSFTFLFAALALFGSVQGSNESNLENKDLCVSTTVIFSISGFLIGLAIALYMMGKEDIVQLTYLIPSVIAFNLAFGALAISFMTRN
uniref:Uncharacterized protein n=1 Tax=viral metagenome TaxID=1070528 RepID=A0A6C0APG7_9ZZZZ